MKRQHTTRVGRRLTPVLASFLAVAVGCGGDGSSDPRGFDGIVEIIDDPGVEILEVATLSVDETRIVAYASGDELIVQLPVENLAGNAQEVEARFELVRLGDISASASESFSATIADGGSTLEASIANFASLPRGTADSGQLGEWVLRYQVQLDSGAMIKGRRSLFTAFVKRELHVMTARQLNPDGQSSVRIVTLDSSSGEPIANADVRIELLAEEGGSGRVVFDGQTDEDGSAVAPLDVDDADIGSRMLAVTVETDEGSESVSTPVEVVRNERIMLTTDKPVYQPGQRMHLRALALSRPSLSPSADRPVRFEVSDAEGNRVFRHNALTNEYGVAAVEVPLASRLNEGNWQLDVIMDDTITSRTVRVERYALPKYDIDLTPDLTYYRPGDTALLDIDAQYFFGEPVAGGSVTIQPFVFDVGFNPLTPIEAELDELGLARVEVPIPDYLVGQELNEGNAFVRIEATVRDLAGQEESVATNLTVSSRDMLISTIPAAAYIPGEPTPFYILTRTPTGHGVAADCTYEGGAVSTDDQGYARTEITGTPGSWFTLSCTDALDRVESVPLTIPATTESGEVAVLTDRSLYEVGESVELDLFTDGNPPRLFIDVVRESQTLLTESVELTDGEGSYTLDLSADLTGALQIHAYYITRDARIVRGSRIVYVDGAGDLSIQYETDQESYRPGEEAELTVEVTDLEGNGVQSAVGLTIVDEAVFAVADARPGLERVYFQLEEELLEPQYNLYGYTMEDVVAIGGDEEERERAADVVLAATAAPGFEVTTSSASAARQSAVGRSQRGISHVAESIEDAFLEMVERDLLNNSDWESQARIQELIDTLGDVYDPWGRALRIETDGRDSYVYGIAIRSAGIDELWDTDDDLYTYLDQYTFWDWDDDWGSGGGGGVDVGMSSDSGGGWAGEDAASEWEDPRTEEEEEGGSAGPRVRDYFPETLFVEPNLITGEDGRTTLNIPLADNITTWRITGTASSADGQLGSGTGGIRVFQPFFVDIDFPASLTQNDYVSVPVALFNYLEEPQTVRLEADIDASGEWFTLLSGDTHIVELEPGEITVRYFDINVDEVGLHAFQVSAYGSEESDAVRRVVRVEPDGQAQPINISDRLDGTVDANIVVPATAIDNASSLLLRIHPGLFSQVVEGLDSLFQMPSGCFEQTSSTTYPNILLLDYLRRTDQSSPELEMQATEYIAQGYQRLVSYEVAGGGFEWFGNDPAHRILTAYGLLQFHDMSQVFDVDPHVISRTQQWLISQQEADGRWRAASEGIHEGATNNFQDSDLRATAYIAYALLESGAVGFQIDNGVTWLLSNDDDAEDAYTLALLANAYLTAGERAEALEILRALDESKTVGEDGEADVYWWESESQSLYYESGNTMSIQTTALIAQAMIRAGGFSDTVNGIVTYLIQQKDTFGNWSSTQSTIQTLRTFVMLTEASSAEAVGTVSVYVHEELAGSVELDASNADLMHQFDLSERLIEGDNAVRVVFEGEGSVMYQLVGEYFLPWELVDDMGSLDTLSIDMDYDRTELAVDDTVEVTATVHNHTNERLDMVMLDLGVPPGFDVVMSDFDVYIEDEETPVTRVERRGRQLTVYLYGLEPSETLSLSYHLRATMVVEASTPPSSAWLYYDSDVRSETEPVDLTVR